jgi:hypothetical protein
MGAAPVVGALVEPDQTVTLQRAQRMTEPGPIQDQRPGQLVERDRSWASGDVFINRGGLHTWVNNGSVPAVGAAIMVHAKPVEVNGNELRTVYPNQQKADTASATT